MNLTLTHLNTSTAREIILPTTTNTLFGKTDLIMNGIARSYKSSKKLGPIQSTQL